MGLEWKQLVLRNLEGVSLSLEGIMFLLKDEGNVALLCRPSDTKPGKKILPNNRDGATTVPKVVPMKNVSAGNPGTQNSHSSSATSFRNESALISANKGEPGSDNNNAATSVNSELVSGGTTSNVVAEKK